MALYLETEIKKLRNVIKEISKLAEGQVFEAMKALLSDDDAAGKKEVKRAENKIDKLDMKIDQICQTIVALQQPVASDLRFVLSAMQIGNEAERIGDLAVDVIKQSRDINEKHDLIVKLNITDIAREVEEITIRTNEYFKSLEENKIVEIFALDSSIKDGTKKAIEGIIEEMKINPHAVTSGTNLVIVLKHLERISDHCTNIAEAIYFVITAKIVKHSRFEEKK